MKLREGNVFTPVCDSVQGGACVPPSTSPATHAPFSATHPLPCHARPLPCMSPCHPHYACPPATHTPCSNADGMHPAGMLFLLSAGSANCCGLTIELVLQISGPSGCGKTQFCMMLSVITTLPEKAGGLGGGVLYIDTESAFSAERLVLIVLRIKHTECLVNFCQNL